jgi:hypothetical protein
VLLLLDSWDSGPTNSAIRCASSYGYRYAIGSYVVYSFALSTWPSNHLTAIRGLFRNELQPTTRTVYIGLVAPLSNRNGFWPNLALNSTDVSVVKVCTVVRTTMNECSLTAGIFARPKITNAASQLQTTTSPAWVRAPSLSLLLLGIKEACSTADSKGKASLFYECC